MRQPRREYRFLSENPDSATLGEVERRITYLAALLVPLAGHTYVGDKRKLLPVVAYIVKDGFKGSGKESDDTVLLTSKCQALRELLACNPETYQQKRLLYGRLIRELKDRWQQCALCLISCIESHEQRMDGA
jgi:hypothetical protein